MIEKPGGLQMKGSGKRNGRSCSLQTALHHSIAEAAEPDDSEYGDATHFRVAQYTSMVTIAAGHMEELGYPGHIEELGYPGHIGIRNSRTHRRTRTSRISRIHRS